MSNVISKIKICKHEETLIMEKLYTENYYNTYLSNLSATIHSCGRTNNTLISFHVKGIYDGELDILMQTGNLYLVGYSIDNCNYILQDKLVSYVEEPKTKYILSSKIEANRETLYLFAPLISEALRFKPIKGYFNNKFKNSKSSFYILDELLFAQQPLFHFKMNVIDQPVTIKSLRNDWADANSEQYTANGQIFSGDRLVGEKYIEDITSIKSEQSCTVYNHLWEFVASYDNPRDCISPKDNKCSAKEAKKQKLTTKELVHKNIKYFSKILENEHEINLPYNITYKFTYLDATKTILISCVAAYGAYYFIYKLLPYLSDSVSHYRNEILDRAVGKLNVQEIQGQIVNQVVDKFDQQLLEEQVINRITHEVLSRLDFHNSEESAIARAAQMILEKIPSDFIEAFPELMRTQFSEQVRKTIIESIDIDTLNNHLQDAMLRHAQEEISMEEIKTGVVNEFVGQIQSQISTLLDQRTQYYDHT